LQISNARTFVLPVRSKQCLSATLHVEGLAVLQ
jgi:hypothetical protein